MQPGDQAVVTINRADLEELIGSVVRREMASLRPAPGSGATESPSGLSASGEVVGK